MTGVTSSNGYISSSYYYSSFSLSHFSSLFLIKYEDHWHETGSICQPKYQLSVCYQSVYPPKRGETHSVQTQVEHHYCPSGCRSTQSQTVSFVGIWIDFKLLSWDVNMNKLKTVQCHFFTAENEGLWGLRISEILQLNFCRTRFALKSSIRWILLPQFKLISMQICY